MVAATEQLALDMDTNLRDLRSGSLKMITLFAGAIGYFWLMALLWRFTVNGVPQPLVGWLGSTGLVLANALAYALARRHPACASWLLIVGVLSANACAMSLYRLHDLAYLLAIPVTFASVFLGPEGTATTALFSAMLIAGINRLVFGLGFTDTQTLLPLFAMGMITLSSWLSVRNLNTALWWVWSGYERVREHEQTASQRGAELRQALKSLDEATYRVERLNHMLSISREQADEARRLKQRFARTISHELRTPLNLIVGFTELMARSPEYYGEPLPLAYMRDLSIVHRNASHLQSLVNDVLDLARIEAAQMSLVLEETDLAALAQETINATRSLVESRGLTLQLHIEPNLPHLPVDPTRIRQVLFNLLNNAARFTERGGVEVTASRRGQEVIFSVADTGVGIPSADLKRVFEEFEQLDRSKEARATGNVGLGLTISRGFVELHGGRIWADSVVGVGSTFSFALPIPGELGLAAPSGPSPADYVTPGKHDDRNLLLVVTGSSTAAGLLTRYLHGIRTTVVGDLERARRAAADLLPQVVVVDSASIPVSDGRLPELARSWGLAEIPFIACPLPGEQPLRERLAVDGYLIKPVTREALWDQLRELGRDADRVLIVDDDDDFVRLLSRMLDDPVRRYSVHSARTLEEAVEALRRWYADLVLLDLALPLPGSFALVEQMRSEPQWRNTPIVALADREDMAALLLQGSMSITRGAGLLPGEMIRWIQSVADVATQAGSAS